MRYREPKEQELKARDLGSYQVLMSDGSRSSAALLRVRRVGERLYTEAWPIQQGLGIMDIIPLKGQYKGRDIFLIVPDWFEAEKILYVRYRGIREPYRPKFLDAIPFPIEPVPDQP